MGLKKIFFIFSFCFVFHTIWRYDLSGLMRCYGIHNHRDDQFNVQNLSQIQIIAQETILQNKLKSN